MRHRKTEDTMFLLGGALLGAAAMYLMDPEQGQRRRQKIADAASDAYESARDMAGEGWHQVAGKAHDLGERLSAHASRLSGTAGDTAQSLADQARDLVSDLTDRASSYVNSGSKYARNGRRWLGDTYDSASQSASDYADAASDAAGDRAGRLRDWGNGVWDSIRNWGQKAGDRASDWTSSAKDRAGSLASSARSWFGHEDESEGVGAMGITSTALGCCLVGAGAMYLFDPRQGRSRRTWLMDKTTSCVRTTGRMMRATGQHMANRLRGTMYETRSMARGMMSRQQIDSEQLLQRIRSELGHWVSNPSLIQVMTDADGDVTLSGSVLRAEADRLLSMVSKVPGVGHLINRLDLRDDLSPGLRDSTTMRGTTASQL